MGLLPRCPSFLPSPDTLKSENVRWRLKVKARLFPARPSLESVELRRSAERNRDETAWVYARMMNEVVRVERVSYEIDRFQKFLLKLFSFFSFRTVEVSFIRRWNKGETKVNYFSVTMLRPMKSCLTWS